MEEEETDEDEDDDVDEAVELQKKLRAAGVIKDAEESESKKDK
jgi:hypothetical protein